MKTEIVLFAFSITALNTFAQSKWTVSPFDQKVFIENKGQFNGENGNESKKILFETKSGGVDLCFTANGLTYKHDESVARMREEKEALEKGQPNRKENEEEEERETMKSIPSYFSIEWVGSNPNTEIIAEEPVSFYYTYGSAGKDANSTIKANAYKKIIYKNLYPGIDAEYVFPSDSSGIKYSLILHPGANPSVIKMKYEDASAISLDSYGNVVIKSSFGKFIDHAPRIFYKDNGKPIASSFSIDNNVVSFLFSRKAGLKGSQGGLEVIIDPWITNPTFTGYNAAYDVNYDLNGNVYVFGSFSDFQLAKLNNVGVIQWIYNVTGFTSILYGDFAVDEINGTSYLTEGYEGIAGAGARIFKVNTFGFQIGTFPGNPNMNEMWRAEYNRCINKIVIAGGGNKLPSFNAAVLDTDMINMNIVQFVSPTDHTDLSLLAIDNNSNFCYMASGSFSSPNYDSKIFKCPIPNLQPFVFTVPHGHKFEELSSITYINNYFGGANGMNGMTVSPSWLYTYDSDSLKRWDKNTGTFVAGIDVSSLPPTYNGGIQVSWGGLSADECDNIYAGVQSSIKEYNTSLALINTFALPDTVYDVKLGPNNKLYACGQGFVTEIDVTSNNTTIAVIQTPASCDLCNGTATVSTLSCGGNPTGFSYSWNTSPVQTTQTATGLCPGNYSVILTTNCFISFTGTVTVNNVPGIALVTVTVTPASCNTNNGSAMVNVTGGTSPYVYSWNSVPLQNTANVTGLGEGTYTVTVMDNSGCVSKTGLIITVAECNENLYIPNSFTPNNDGINDVFIPQTEIINSAYYSLIIFDRWGNKIFETNNYKQGWDGKVKNTNTLAQQDVYVWKVNLIDFQNQQHDYFGRVTILK